MAALNPPVALVQAVHDSTLDENLRNRFRALLDEIRALDPDRNPQLCNDAGYQAMLDHLKDAITANPVLAKTVNMEHESLLYTICDTNQHVPGDQSHPSIKFLIDKNPSALAWLFAMTGKRPLAVLAGSSSLCVLLLYVAQHYSWIFEDKHFLDWPPHIALVEKYAQGFCSASVVRRFYEYYPQGLRQDFADGRLPLHYSVTGLAPSVDLVQWMAQQYPAAMLTPCLQGSFPLHGACLSLAVISEGSEVADRLEKICHFLAEEGPMAICTPNRIGALPIHFLGRRSNRKRIQSVIISLLREHPESFDMPRIYDFPAPGSVPFIQAISPVLAKERAMNEANRLLEYSSAAWDEALAVSKDKGSLQSKASGNFNEWATSLIAASKKRMEEEIPKQLENICEEFEGDDIDEEEDDGDDGWEFEGYYVEDELEIDEGDY